MFVDAQFNFCLTYDDPWTMMCHITGTYSSVSIFKALRAENAAYHHLSADDRMLEAQEEVMDLKNAFYPARCEWKNEILSRGLKVLVTASDFLSENGLRSSEDNES